MAEPIDLHQVFGSISDLAASRILEVPAIFKSPSKIEDCLEYTNENSVHEYCIPIIDLSDLHGKRHTSIKEEIQFALEEWGFLQVINHGVPPTLMDDALHVYKQIFEMPREEKYYTKDHDAPFKFFVSRAFGSVLPHIWRDAVCVHPQKGLDKMPTNPPTFREVTMAYYEAVTNLKRELLNILSESLGLGETVIDDVAGKGDHYLAANFYPPCPQPKDVMGAIPHSDFGTLTILLQDDVGGLDIRDKNHNWIQVKPLKHAFIINAADQLEILSNGKFKSVEHRVRVNSEVARISIATFFTPKFTDTIGPLAQIVGEEGPFYKDTLYADYCNYVSTTGLTRKNIIENVKVSNPILPL